MTPEAQKLAAEPEGAPAGRLIRPEDRSAFERCITRGLPGAMMPGFYNHNYQILQAPGYVAILVEMIHDARIIPLDGRPHLGPGHPATGWATRAAAGKATRSSSRRRTSTTRCGSSRSSRSRRGRISNSSSASREHRDDTIDYQFTVTDPTMYTRPWTAAIPMSKFEGPIFEYACHEGNYGMGGILRGARMDEKLAAEAPKKP